MCQSELITKQYSISPASGKRLIAKSLLQIPSILDALENRTVVVVAGTTNGYVAEEFLSILGQLEGFSRNRFYRGVTLPYNYKKTFGKTGTVSTSASSNIVTINSGLSAESYDSTAVNSKTAAPGDDNKFPGDVVIVKGTWAKGMTIFDIADELKTGDIIFKGANAVNLEMNQAAILIGNPTGGTISPILQCNIGRRVELYLPVGLEKRISGNISEIAAKLNSTSSSGTRYMPVCGNIVTELQAIKLLTGADAQLIASGGVCGAEGSYWLAVTGTEEQLISTDKVFKKAQEEINFILS